MEIRKRFYLPLSCRCLVVSATLQFYARQWRSLSQIGWNTKIQNNKQNQDGILLESFKKSTFLGLANRHTFLMGITYSKWIRDSIPMLELDIGLKIPSGHHGISSDTESELKCVKKNLQFFSQKQSVLLERTVFVIPLARNQSTFQERILLRDGPRKRQK